MRRSDQDKRLICIVAAEAGQRAAKGVSLGGAVRDCFARRSPTRLGESC